VLFDLQGKRRRVVQGTYLMLAVLMGGGLVLFGIGSGASGGLFDALGGGGGSSNGNSAIEKRIDKNEKLVQQHVKVERARKALTRDYFQLATAKVPSGATSFPDDAKSDLNKAAANWRAYLALEPKKVDDSLATLALQLFDQTALNKPKDGQKAAQVIAAARNNSQAYIALVQYATLAGDKRTANLAGIKAVQLAPKGQKKVAEENVKAAKKPQTPQTTGAQPSGG
jgi:hypothetical protein